MGVKTFHDAFAKDNTPENIALYLEKSFSLEIQLTQLYDPKVVFLIAELEGRPVGFAKLNLNRDHNSQENPKTLEIERIYALQEFISKGIIFITGLPERAHIKPLVPRQARQPTHYM